MTRLLHRFGGPGVVALLAANPAFSGGIDRSGQDISALFQPGTYTELSFGEVAPSVSGIFTHPVFGDLASGNVAPAFTVVGGAVKMDLSDKISAALIVDEPWAAAVNYGPSSYPLTGTSAHVSSGGLTALGRYRINDTISVHAGLRYITASGDVTLSGIPYASTYSSDSDLAYVLGAAYEIPAIALRGALTYSSATTYNLPGTFGDVSAKLPQSVNFDFQTGIAADTLLFGQVRWANWKDAHITDSLVGDLISYDSDVVTYTLGVGRKLSDSFSAAVTLGYEAPTNRPVSNLTPTDGMLSLGIGGTWTQGPMQITAGISQMWLGDATTLPAGAFPGGVFSGNSALGVGVKIAYTF